jgi:pimeloyl-ACP methyl ester carboxylesterase
VIALHGFTMGQPAVDAHVLMAAQWYEVGFDVVLPTLPCHGVRAPQESRYSGEHFGSWHVGCLNECVRQAVYDLHILKSWLAERSAAPIGLVGLSLGGYLTALAAGLFPDLAFVIPLAAPVCLAALPLRLFEAEAGESAPLALAALRRAYRVHSPLTYPLAVPNERVLIVAGRGDRIVPPEHPYRLWRHWGRPPIHWFSGSHTAPFRRDRIFTRILEHVAGLGLGSAAQARRKPASASAARGREEGDAG